jgi:outer membrane protein
VEHFGHFAVEPDLNDHHRHGILSDGLDRRREFALGLTLAVALAIWPAQVGAEEITRPALSAAVTELVGEVVRTNPDIEAQRGQVRILEARLAAARAARLPDISANLLVQHRKLDVKNGGPGDAEFTLAQGTVEGRMMLFDGRQTSNAVKAATHELASGQAQFHAAVAEVLLSLLTAAADVRRDHAVREFTGQQSDAIADELRAISRRVELSEATRTDQALARSRLAVAQSTIIAARQQAATSQSAFQRVTGRPAGALPVLPDLAALPPTLAAALARADENNPRVRAARRTAIAARYGSNASKGALLPKVDAVGGYEYLTGGVANIYTGKLPDDRSSAYGGVEIAVPLFRPRTYAEIGRTKGLYAQRMAELASARRSAADQIATTWSQWRGAADTIETARISVSATEQAAIGIRREWEIGNRTVVEVLDAQYELLSARVALERAMRDEYVSRATILALIGDLGPAAILRAPYRLAARFADKPNKAK